jgi:hypothetical protein
MRLAPAPHTLAARLCAGACIVFGLGLGGCGSSSPRSARGSARASGSATRTRAGASAAAPSQPPPIGPEGIALEAGAPLAPASTTTAGAPVAGIRCAPTESVAYHIHAHLLVYVGGLPRALPGGIGIVGAVATPTPRGPFYQATGCYYWLHTHTSDGVIHIESPTKRIYTLGDFFAEWRQPLDAHRVAGAAGPVTAIVNGSPWTRTPRAIPLLPHEDIQLAVGDPVPPFQRVDWSQSSL